MELDPDLPEVMGDADQIQQVIVNIANNAHHAMSHYEGERRLTITTQSDSENIRVSIADTGPGIPQDKIDIIFEPFFTTKKSGEGTGLGLKISRDIIHEHDGEIYVDSREGEGARFTIELPLKVEVPQTQIS